MGVPGNVDYIGDRFFFCYQVIEDSEVIRSLSLPEVWRAVVMRSVEGVGGADEELSGVLVSISGVEVRQIVVGGSGRAMSEEVDVAVVRFRILDYWKTRERGVGVEASVVGVYDRSRVRDVG